MPDKVKSYGEQTLFPRLDREQQAFVRRQAKQYRFTFQELRQVCEAALDLRMWGERSLHEWWEERERGLALEGRTRKKRLLRELRDWLRQLRARPKIYPEKGMERPAAAPLRRVVEQSERKILGLCPAASEETVCCNLRTLDAVENCGFGCTYCTIQTFYGDALTFDADLPQKLEALELDPDRWYHIGTGQSSDALMWGNQYGLLDALCAFAWKRPKVILEFKTKSKNVSYFLERRLPGNLFLSWSLNPAAIIRSEEHFTASLEERLCAARAVADQGIRVAFHFHPIIYYQGWEEDYREMVQQVMACFAPQEVLFVSLGTLTFIKPVIRAIRERGWASRILQMELAPAPKGKLSYPEEVKERLFRHLYRSFSPWHESVYFYLCMESARFWKSTFGRVYGSNAEFEADIIRHLRQKL